MFEPLFKPESIIFLTIFTTWLFWMWILLECVMIEQLTGRDKVGWTIVITTTYCIGALLYLICRRPKRIVKVGQ